MEQPVKPVGLMREVWTRSKKFILPDDAISLKTIFDNVRNYLMCAAVVAAVGALGPYTSGGPSILIAFSLILNRPGF